MIHVVDEKRLNDFKPCRCIKPKDLFSRIGKRFPDISFESSEEVIPMNMSKIDSIEYIQNYDRMMAQREHSNDSSSEPHEENRNEVSEES